MADPATRDERRRARHLRPRRFDDLGLKRALSDRLLPSLVAAMAFLAALALAGFVGANALGTRWQAGAGATLTIQVPQPGAPTTDAPAAPTRRDATLAVLHATSWLAAVHPLTEGELADLLRPWLGTDADSLTLPLPAVIQLRLPPATPAAKLADLRARLAAAAPGVLVEDQGVWAGRLATLARSLQACSGLALLVVVAVAAAVIAVATRAGLVSRRQAIEIVHGLGAADGYIAGRFASRATWLAALGGLAGAMAAMPLLLGLSALAAPFAGVQADAAPMPLSPAALAAALPPSLWVALPCLPAGAAAIGWLTAQATVRRWLRRLA